MAVEAPPRWMRIAVPVLGLLIVLLLAAAFWTGGRLRDAQAAADDREAALRAAGTHAVNLLSVGHRTVDADIRRILDTSTGQARAEYSRNASALKETTTRDKVVQTGALRAVGLVSLEGGTARVMVVGDAVIEWDGGGNAPQERFYRWTMEVTRTGGRWLVSKAEMVP
ncbi:Mce associated membrane protein [Planomonospora alba]|uniref:Mce associated membrane protein n=1 Tax=Planomonospora alba TaxID=161354 RepID=A0ABP6MRC3_9ACTN